MDTFGFSSWPFAGIPTEERAVNLWADRNKAREQMDTILDDWINTERSSINLIWADLGSGKTHTLYHLKSRCIKAGSLIPFYVLLPTAIIDFLGLYKAIATAFDWQRVRSQLQPIGTWAGRSLNKALTWLTTDADQVRQNLAERWLTGEKMRAAECAMLGVSKPITTPEEAVSILATSINALTSHDARVVMMIDEYQRVAEGKRRQLQEIGHGIHTLYNACSDRFSLVLSCATGMADDYTLVLTPEVVSRLSPRRIELPYLTAGDTTLYIRDLFSHYRHKDARPSSAYSPLTETIVRELSEYLSSGFNSEVTPRRINEAFDLLVSFMRQKGLKDPLAAELFRRWLAENGDDIIRNLSS